MTIFGWDASDYDWGRGPMDLNAAVADGIQFFTHKATEGTRVEHAHYGEALNRARSSGMKVYGAYMVPRTPGLNGHGSIDQQVKYFLAYLNANTPWWRTDLRFRILQMDTEKWGYDDVSPALGAQACALLRQYAPEKWVPHYAPRWSYGDSIPGKEPLWASSYGSNPTLPYRQAYPGDGSSGWAPYSGRTPAILQYGSRLKIGTQPGCDANAIKDPQVWAEITGSEGDIDMATGDQIMEFLAQVIERNNLWPIAARTAELDKKVAALIELAKAQGADVDALLARPVMELTAEQVDALGEKLAAAVISRPDNPLGTADKPTIKDALKEVLREGVGEAAPTQPNQDQ